MRKLLVLFIPFIFACHSEIKPVSSTFLCVSALGIVSISAQDSDVTVEPDFISKKADDKVYRFGRQACVEVRE